MIRDCPYLVQVAFWIVVLGLAGWSLRLIGEAITRRYPRRKDAPWR